MGAVKNVKEITLPYREKFNPFNQLHHCGLILKTDYLRMYATLEVILVVYIS